jgi:hypothetical protein
MPSLQDLEDSLEDKCKIKLSPPLDSYTKPLESYNKQHLLLTLASTIFSNLGPCLPN